MSPSAFVARRARCEVHRLGCSGRRHINYQSFSPLRPHWQPPESDRHARQVLLCHFIFDATKYEFAEQSPSRVSGDIAPYQVISRPSPSTVAMFENTNRNSLPFLRAAGIDPGSKKHKEFTVCYISSYIPCDLDSQGAGRQTTIRALHHQYLHPFKYVEEQPPDCVDQLIAKVYMHIKDQLQTDYWFCPRPKSAFRGCTSMRTVGQHASI